MKPLAVSKHPTAAARFKGIEEFNLTRRMQMVADSQNLKASIFKNWRNSIASCCFLQIMISLNPQTISPHHHITRTDEPHYMLWERNMPKTHRNDHAQTGCPGTSPTPKRPTSPVTKMWDTAGQVTKSEPKAPFLEVQPESWGATVRPLTIIIWMNNDTATRI